MVVRVSGKEGINLDSVLSREDLISLQNHVQLLQEKYHLGGDVRILLEHDDDFIPCSIFNTSLGVLESVVKYLRENRAMSTRAISEKLQRTQCNVSVTYKKACQKDASRFESLDYSVKIPFSVFCGELTAFEAVVMYLKDELGLNYRSIGIMMKRDERVIWATYKRARGKR